MCGFSGTASGGTILGRNSRRSSEEERHSCRFRIPFSLHKRRYGDATATTPGFPTAWWSKRGCDSGWQRDRRIAPTRGLDLSNISEPKRRSTDFSIKATDERSRRNRSFLPYKSKNVGKPAAKFSVVDRRPEHAGRHKLDTSNTFEHGNNDDDECTNVELSRSNNLKVEWNQWSYRQRNQPAEGDRCQRHIHGWGHAVQSTCGALRQRWRRDSYATTKFGLYRE